MNRYELPHCDELIKDFEKLLNKMLGEPVKIMLIYENYRIGLNEIKAMVCEAFGMPWDKIMQDSRKGDIIYARMSFAYLARRFTSKTDGEIGDYMKKDRTTVINNHQVITHLLFTQDIKIYPYVNSIIELIETTYKNTKNEAEEIQN